MLVLLSFCFGKKCQIFFGCSICQTASLFYNLLLKLSSVDLFFIMTSSTSPWNYVFYNEFSIPLNISHRSGTRRQATIKATSNTFLLSCTTFTFILVNICLAQHCTKQLIIFNLIIISSQSRKFCSIKKEEKKLYSVKKQDRNKKAFHIKASMINVF